jgi:hypothetical protein
MGIQSRIERPAACAAFVFLSSVGCLLTAQAYAADGSESELPPEVRAVLDAPAAAPIAPPVGPRADDERRFSTAQSPSNADPLETFSLVTLGAGGVLGLVGALLAGIGSDERVCGLAGCVLRESDSVDDRRSAGHRLIGAGVGVGLIGAAGLAWAHLLPLEGGESRDSTGQLVAGLSVSAAGASFVGLGIVGALQERKYADDASTAGLLVGGVLALGTGVILLSTRSPDEQPSPRAPSAAWPRISVGLGSAEASWSF